MEEILVLVAFVLFSAVRAGMDSARKKKATQKRNKPQGGASASPPVFSFPTEESNPHGGKPRYKRTATPKKTRLEEKEWQSSTQGQLDTARDERGIAELLRGRSAEKRAEPFRKATPVSRNKAGNYPVKKKYIYGVDLKKAVVAAEILDRPVSLRNN
ncbi:MAG: hypothetical protein ACQEQ4_09355 [Fibrobacterota bacterium]